MCLALRALKTWSSDKKSLWALVCWVFVHLWWTFTPRDSVCVHQHRKQWLGAALVGNTKQNNFSTINHDKAKFLLLLSVSELPLLLFGKVTVDNSSFDCKEKFPAETQLYCCCGSGGRTSLPVLWKVTADTTNIPVWIAGRSVSQLCMTVFLLTAL